MSNENKQINKKNDVNKSKLPPVIVTVLGGLGEVGKNSFAIEMGNEIWVVDAGIKFASDSVIVEGIIPSFEYLKQNEKKIKGLIITHGHEDHIGAVPHLLYQVKIPKIYAGKMAANQIFGKLRERGIGKIPTEIINNKSVIKSRNFEIKPFNVNHSIPDAYGLSFTTPHGHIVHTGDFKFDLSPVGTSADILKMAQMGKEGVDMMLSDSTNSTNPNWSTSESTVSKEIDEIIKNTKDRIIVATFASNVYRVREILKAGLANGRKIALLGWSMDKNTSIAKKIKYINIPENQFIQPRDIKKYKNEKLLIVCTGTQGETNAALSKMSDGRHKEVKITKSDTVVFASSAIPGNFEAVEVVKNRLVKLKATVIDNKINPNVHGSGHASKSEQLLMLNLIKPRNFVPVHGESFMLKKHSDSSTQTGVAKKNTFILQNGGRVKLVNGKVSFAGTVPAGNVYVDSSTLTGQSMKVVADRDHMSKNGVITVSVGINSAKNEIVVHPKLTSRGTLNMTTNKELIEEVQNLVKKDLIDYYNSGKKVTFGTLKEIIRSSAEGRIMEAKKISPIVVPIILNKKQN